MMKEKNTKVNNKPKEITEEKRKSINKEKILKKNYKEKTLKVNQGKK